jgi:AraC-like DNA-binding protein
MTNCLVQRAGGKAPSACFNVISDMKWITREKPKIDRIACPWLIKNFIDQDAEFIYVPFQEVLARSKELDAIPYDVPDVKFTHHGSHCTFDSLIEAYNIKDPAVQAMAPIIRGADTDRHEIAEQASGLWAISAGLAYNIKDDHQLLEKGMLLYDALYSWANHLQQVKHTQQPFEQMLVNVFNQIIRKKKGSRKKTPPWARQLKELIQDQIDTNFSLSLKSISKELQVNPAYLSREFSRYFDDLSFGEYIRKLRIEKAIQLIHTSKYSLTEIAYLTGFSDQSHFTRIFKRFTGKNPSEYKRKFVKK